MVKKIISLFLVFAMVNSYANTLPNNISQLENAFDDFNFAVNVEWDQQDKGFYNDQVEKLQDVIKGLQAKGLSSAELIEFASRQMNNKKMVQEMNDMIVHVETSKMSSSEARKFIMSAISKDSTDGANWAGDGDGTFWLWFGLLVIVIVVAAAAGGGGSSSSSCYDEYVCYDYYDNYGNWLYEDCFYESFCN